MTDETQAGIRKRLLLLSVMLGMMFGVTVLLIVKAIVKGNPSLIAVALPMFVIAIPMASTLVRLRKTVNRQPPAPPA